MNEINEVLLYRSWEISLHNTDSILFYHILKNFFWLLQFTVKFVITRLKVSGIIAKENQYCRVCITGVWVQGYMGYPCSGFPLKTHLFEMLRNTSLSRQPRYHLRINSWSARAQSLESAVLSSNIPQLDLFPLHDCAKCWNYFQSFPFKKSLILILASTITNFPGGHSPFFLWGIPYPQTCL